MRTFLIGRAHSRIRYKMRAQAIGRANLRIYARYCACARDWTREFMHLRTRYTARVRATDWTRDSSIYARYTVRVRACDWTSEFTHLRTRYTARADGREFMHLRTR